MAILNNIFGMIVFQDIHPDFDSTNKSFSKIIQSSRP